MQRLILLSAFIFFMLSGSKTLFVTNEAYAGCCPCRSASYATNYTVSSTYLVGCTPPGQKYKGKVCAYCALPDSETLRSNISSGNSLSDMWVIRKLPFLTVTPPDLTDRALTLLKGAECTRRSLELRLLGNDSDNLPL